MKKGFFLLICLLPLLSFAQSANSWINFSQTYYRIPVAKDGVYRLTYSDLQNAGFPVNSVDPRFIQLIHRGIQQAIFFKNDQQPADSKFDATEYFEFYGQHRDGKSDTKLYTPTSAQPHPYYNIYSDTAAYFLTWNQLPVQGKRMASFSEVNSPAVLVKETSQTCERLSLFTTDYSGGETLSDVVQYSYFNDGEGWTGSVICTVTSGCTGFTDFIIDNINNTVTSASPPQLELQLSGREDLNHLAEVYVGANTGVLRLISTQSFVNFETPTILSGLNWSDIGADGKMVVRVKALGVGGSRDRMSVSYIKLNFAQGFDLTAQTEKQLVLSSNGTGKSYIELTNAPSNLRLWDITDQDNIVTIGTGLSGSTATAVIPNTTVSRKLFVSNQFITPALKKVSFRNITPSSHNFVIITNAALTKPGLGYSDPVKAYASYRASAEGGQYDTLSMTIDQLYSQFNYGETSSLAIYEFVKFMYAGGNMKYLFLIGKGRDINFGFYRKTTLGASELRDLVPTGGYPSSDMVFSTGLNGVANLPAVPTGRIPATTPAQVAAYLNKIKETEASSFNESWHKSVLHLSGGIQPFELTLFKQYMDGFAAVAKEQFYGASVKTLGKHEATAIELINISEQVNNGVNLITFFGHSSPTSTDIDIGFVTNPSLGYNNPGKYPSFLVNGCNAGEFFGGSMNFGEDWILAANKGARNFIANSSYGFSNDLKLYSDLFYQSAFADSSGIRAGIGSVQIEVAKRFLTLSSGINAVAISHQMVLLGDPSLKLFGAGKPDFEVTNNSLSAVGFDGNQVEASADSFALKIVVKNYGLTTNTPLKINVERTLNDNTQIHYTSSYPQPLNQDTLTFIIRREQSKNFSNNTFAVTLDPDNTISELNEENNKGTFTLSISGTVNLFPSAYGIVNKREANLVFQNSDMLSESRQYLVEMDTTDTFNSPALQKFTLTGKVLLKQKVQLLATDSTVYYWRTRFAQASPQENDEWQTTSFSYIVNGEEGWTQMHFPQFTEDVSSGLIKDMPTGKLQFETTTADIFVKTYGKDNAAPASNAAFSINGVDYWYSIQGFNCRSNTINLVAFNKNTVVPYEGIQFTFSNAGGRACGREPQIINSFLSNETLTGNGDDLIQYVNNINSSDSVVLFTLGDAGLDLWSSTVKDKLGEFGISVTQIDGLIKGEPVIIFGKKGAPAGTAKIIRSTLSPETEQELVLSKTLTGKVSSGSMKSTLIGPAHSWKQFTSRISEKTANDEVRFDLYGVGIDGTETLIQSNIASTFDLSSLSATDYPHLKLVYFTRDDTDLSAAQLKKWFVFFEPVAEGLLVYKGSAAQLTLQEGETWTGNYSFVNISEKTFTDSLKVEVTTFNKKSLVVENSSFKINPPLPGDSSHFQIVRKPKAGVNDVDVFVNRRIQPEMYYENNAIDLVDYLNVLPDQIGPVLDITVDGRYLSNGDVVSSNPAIRLILKDENSLFYKTDTTGVDVFLKYPCATSNCNFSRVSLSGNEVKWTPASAANDFTIMFRPVNLPEGEYTLRIQAQDASGNKAGIEPYEVTFTVKFETTVQFIPVYPNPSRNDFFFRFQLTGQSELDKFKLQIWSAEGRLINEFTEEQLTEFYIGTHELRWNARDQQGNNVSPGVYIYRMEAGANGKTESTFGKLVVVR